MSDSTVALLVLAGVIGLFVWNRLPVGAVALGTVLLLWATDLLTLDEATAGFGDPVVVFIATLFVVSEGIDSHRHHRVGRWPPRRPGRRQLLARCSWR